MQVYISTSLYTGDLIVTVTVVVITSYLVLKGNKYRSYLVLKELMIIILTKWNTLT